MDYHVYSLLFEKGITLTTQGKRTALTRLRGLGAALGLALLVTFGVATPASAADAPLLKTGSSWLGGNGTSGGNGVPICGPSTNTTCDGQAHVGGISSNWWQCVELAQRLYTARGWRTGMFVDVGVATDIYDNASTNGFTRQANGSITSVAPGDMLVFSGGGGPGHVGIIDSITDNHDGTKTLRTINQNAYEVMSNVTWNTNTNAVSKYGYMNGSSPSTTFSVMGIVHDSDNTLTESSTSAPAWGGVGNTATFQGSDHLSSGQILHSNEYLMSNNGQTVLMMQTDGNVVLYRGRSAIWSTGTGNNNGAYLTVQTDGNIVVYSASNSPLWWTGTTSVTTLTVQTDGNMVGYPATGPAEWQAGTGGAEPLTYLGTNHLSAGDQIHPNQYIRSADGRYFLMAQTDGNIVLYGPGYHVLWTTNTGGHPGGAYIVVQTDGNIVVYSATSAALWWTGTTNTAILWLQNDGNLVGRNSADAPTWSSGTGGQI
jgi:hypothetical protein